MLLLGVPQLLRLTLTGHNAERDAVALLGDALPSGEFACPQLQELHVSWTYVQVIRNPLDHLFGRQRKQPPEASRTEAEFLIALCDAVVGVLERRGSRVIPLSALSVSVLPTALGYGHSSTFWAEPIRVAGERLRAQLGATVENVDVSFNDADDG